MLGKVSNIVGGGTPSTTRLEYWNGDIEWYAPNEINDSIYVSNSDRKITSKGLVQSSAKILPVGTVLFTSRAGIGKAAILAKESATNQGFQSIVPIVGLLDSYFIYSRTDSIKIQAEKVASGSTFLEISGKQMERIKLHFPIDISEQIKIGDLFKQIDNNITLHQRE